MPMGRSPPPPGVVKPMNRDRATQGLLLVLQLDVIILDLRGYGQT